MDNTMKVGNTAEQRQTTKEAFMVHSYGGAIEVETSPNVWVKINQPLDFEKVVGLNLDFSKLTHNYRPVPKTSMDV